MIGLNIRKILRARVAELIGALELGCEKAKIGGALKDKVSPFYYG